jgi:hypothetical protein
MLRDEIHDETRIWKSAIVPLWTDVDGPARLRARTLDSLILLLDSADKSQLATPLRRERPGAFEFLAAVAVVGHLIVKINLYLLYIDQQSQ